MRGLGTPAPTPRMKREHQSAGPQLERGPCVLRVSLVWGHSTLKEGTQQLRLSAQAGSWEALSTGKARPVAVPKAIQGAEPFQASFWLSLVALVRTAPGLPTSLSWPQRGV